MEIFTVTANDEDKGDRLDKVMARHLPDFSRARLQALIEQGMLTRNGQSFDNSAHKVKPGEVFSIQVPPAVDATPVAQKMDLDIVYEDNALLVLNKPAGLVVHPAAGNHDGTLVNALLAHCGESLSGIGGVKRPGIVHRLDKETSGLMVVAKNDAAHHGLSEQLSTRTLTRVYKTFVWGVVSPAQGRVATRIGRSTKNRQKMAVLETGGRDAITDYKTVETYGMLASLVECRLKTGRTHQIRVHMAHLQHWLIGDPVYGKNAIESFMKLHKADDALRAALLSFPRQALHAAELEFIHPIGKNKIALKAELPPDMLQLHRVLLKYGNNKARVT